MHSYRSLAALCVCAAVLTMPVQAQQLLEPPPPLPTQTEQRLSQITSVPDLEQIAAEFLARGDRRRHALTYERIVELRPHNAAYRYRLAQIYASQGEKTKSYDTLLRLQRAGLSFDPDQDPSFRPVNDTRAYEYIADALRSNNMPFGEGRVAHTLPNEDLLIESMAFDPVSKRVLVGSVRNGAVYAINDDGSLHAVVEASSENGMWGVFDIAVDASRKVLWIASTAVPHFKGFQSKDVGSAGLFKYDLANNKMLEAYVLRGAGGPFMMTSLALAPSGQVFVADGPRNAVYRLDGDQLEPMFVNIEGGSIRGMAVAGSGDRLYFADHSQGLFVVDLNASQAFAVTAPEAVHLGGVDGLMAVDGGLVTIHNDTLPRRVMRLRLSANGAQVLGAVPLVAGQPEMRLPTLGTLVGDEVFFIANSQKNSYDSFGLLRSTARLEPTLIYATPVNVERPEVRLTPPTLDSVQGVQPVED